MKRIDADLSAAFGRGAPPEPPPRKHLPRSVRQANNLWRSFTRWYGARFADQFGKQPDAEWIEVFDDTTDDQVERALRACRAKHVIHPPTLPMFEQLLREAKQAPRAKRGPSTLDRLTDAVLRQPMTEAQRRARWTYLQGLDGTIDGIVVPPGDGAPEIRIHASDLPEVRP